LRRLRLSVTEAEEAWSSEQFTGDSLEQGALANAYALGGVHTLKEIIKDLEDTGAKK
jgi:hypothetical protein